MARGKVQLEALEPIEGHNVELRLLYAIPRTSNHSTDPHMGMLKLWHRRKFIRSPPFPDLKPPPPGYRAMLHPSPAAQLVVNVVQFVRTYKLSGYISFERSRQIKR